MWAEATQGMQSAAAQLGQRRAEAARSAALARKMWQLLRTRLQGDVSCLAASLGACRLAAAGAAAWRHASRSSAARQHAIPALQTAPRPPPSPWQELLGPLWRTEMPLVRVIVDMEAAGLGLNEAILNTGER